MSPRSSLHLPTRNDNTAHPNNRALRCYLPLWVWPGSTQTTASTGQAAAPHQRCMHVLVYMIADVPQRGAGLMLCRVCAGSAMHV